MYSTPGISQSSFSIGRVARSSTSLALNPGMETSTSTRGTLICGSSSRGSTSTAASPNSTEVTITSGVSLESMKVFAMRPAMPSGGGLACRDCFMRQKLQLPRSKLQRNTRCQAPNDEAQAGQKVLLLGVWRFFGVWCLGFGVSFRLDRLAVPQPARAFDDDLFADSDAGHQLDCIADAFAGLYEPQLHMSVLSDEHQFHLAALNDGRQGQAQSSGLADWNGYARKLSGAQTSVRGQVEFYVERAAGGVGHGRDFTDHACDIARFRSSADTQRGAELNAVNERFGHIGFEPERFGVVDFQQRTARCGEVTHIGELARHDTVEGRDNLRVAKHRLGFGHCGVGDTVAGFNRLELLARDRILSEQAAQSLRVAPGLFTQGERLVETRLNFAGVELREQLTGLHLLAGCNQHAFQASAHLGFKSGVQLGAHGADYLLGGDMAYGFDRLDSDPRGRQILVASRLGLLLTAGLPKRGLRQQECGYVAAECSIHTLQLTILMPRSRARRSKNSHRRRLREADFRCSRVIVAPNCLANGTAYCST